MFNCKKLFKLQIRPPSIILLITASQDRWIFPSQSREVRNSMMMMKTVIMMMMMMIIIIIISLYLITVWGLRPSRDITQHSMVFVTDVSGQPIGPILKDQTIFFGCFTPGSWDQQSIPKCRSLPTYSVQNHWKAKTSSTPWRQPETSHDHPVFTVGVSCFRWV